MKPPRDWRGIVALLLTFGVSVGIGATLISMALSPHDVSDAHTTTVATVMGAAIGAVAQYLTSNGNRRDDRDD